MSNHPSTNRYSDAKFPTPLFQPASSASRAARRASAEPAWPARSPRRPAAAPQSSRLSTSSPTRTHRNTAARKDTARSSESAWHIAAAHARCAPLKTARHSPPTPGHTDNGAALPPCRQTAQQKTQPEPLPTHAVNALPAGHAAKPTPVPTESPRPPSPPQLCSDQLAWPEVYQPTAPILFCSEHSYAQIQKAKEEDLLYH